jgi:hypothetical protein
MFHQETLKRMDFNTVQERTAVTKAEKVYEIHRQDRNETKAPFFSAAEKKNHLLGVLCSASEHCNAS